MEQGAVGFGSRTRPHGVSDKIQPRWVGALLRIGRCRSNWRNDSGVAVSPPVRGTTRV